MFIIAIFTIVKNWKEPKYPLISEWINKLWYSYIMEYYLAIKNKPTNKMINFKIMIRERRQVQKEYILHDSIYIKLWKLQTNL